MVQCGEYIAITQATSVAAVLLDDDVVVDALLDVAVAVLVVVAVLLDDMYITTESR